MVNDEYLLSTLLKIQETGQSLLSEKEITFASKSRSVLVRSIVGEVLFYYSKDFANQLSLLLLKDKNSEVRSSAAIGVLYNSDENIFEYAKILGFEKLVVLWNNEKKQGGAKKESILACAFEALLGAIFIEYDKKGYQKAYEFLKDNFYQDILEVEKNICFLNPKAMHHSMFF